MLDFEETSKKSQRVREGSQNSSAGTLPARYCNPSERPKRQHRLRHNDENVFDRLGHRRQSAFNRLSDTYSPSTTKSSPDRANSRDRSHSRGRSPKRDSSPSRDHPRSRDRLRGIKETYGNTCSSYRLGTRNRYHSRDRNRSRSMKRGRESESSLSCVSKSDTGDGGHWKSKRPRGSHKNFPSRNTCGTLGNAYVVSHVQFYPNRDRERMQKKYIKDLVEIHNIKQRDEETIEDFIERFKVETGRMKGAPECMQISIFMHGEKLPPLLNKNVTHRGNHRTNPSVTFQSDDLTFEVSQGKDGGLTGLPLTRTPKEIHATEAGKFKPPPPMIKELVRAGKLSHLIKEIKHGRDQPKLGKKEVQDKDKSLTVYMVQRWHRMTRQKVTQSFARVREITFPPLATSRGTEGPRVIEAKIGGHMIHRMYVDGGSSIEVLYEHCFNWLRPEIKSQMVPAMTSLTGFSGQIIWTLKQLRLLTSNKRNLSSTIHSSRMRKFPVNKGIVTIRSTLLISAEWAAVITASKEILKEAEVRQENFKVALHLNFLDHEVAIGGTLSLNIGSISRKDIRLYDRRKGVRPQNMPEHPSREKTAFHTSHGVYCYTKMPFGLKNIGVTYQQLVDKALIAKLKCIKKSDFHWTPEAKQAFKQLKQHLSKLPMLVAPRPKEELIVYLSAFREAISAVLMTERDTVQTLVYFILADFLVEKPDEASPDASVVNTPQELWTSFTDRSSCVDGSEYEALIAAYGSQRRWKKSIQEKEVATVVKEDGPTWMTPIMECLKDGTFPDNIKEASKLRIKARRYELLEGVLYRQSFLKPWLRCVGPLQADYVIREIHEGTCSMHAGTLSVVAKAMRLGYYWPTMHRDARDMIRKCI
nr:reverse transcriptase domain-containing protein [Tanacetum cinerariifolium]